MSIEPSPDSRTGNWFINRVKYVANITPRKPNLDEMQKCSFVPMEKLKTDSLILDETRLIGAVYDGYTFFLDEDILLAKVTPCFENKNIAIANNLHNGIGFGSSEIYVLRVSENCSNRFLFYRLQEGEFMAKATAAMTGAGGLKRVPSEMLGNYPFHQPDIVEQRQIANFLDHETAKIDTLIEKQQQLIKLLKEKRQAVISHAVTKGLDADVPMRDSGVEWLGQVPAHWALPKIKWLFATESGGTPNTSRQEEYYSEGDFPWIRTTDLNNSELEEAPIAISRKAVIDSACSILPVGSVLVAMYGGAGSIGKHSLLKFESTINQAVCAILPINMSHPEFLHLYIEFYRPYWMVGAEGTRKDPNINQEAVRELKTPFPPLSEQIQIATVTKLKLAEFDHTIKQAEISIRISEERRTALISAAVTGKIDVRNWQPPESTSTTNQGKDSAA